MRGRKQSTFKEYGATITLVKLLTHDDGEPVESPVWHLSDQYGDSARTLCSGEAYGIGESSSEYEYASGFGRDITCDRCRRILKTHQEIKL